MGSLKEQLEFYKSKLNSTAGINKTNKGEGDPKIADYQQQNERLKTDLELTEETLKNFKLKLAEKNEELELFKTQAQRQYKELDLQSRKLAKANQEKMQNNKNNYQPYADKIKSEKFKIKRIEGDIQFLEKKKKQIDARRGNRNTSSTG